MGKRGDCINCDIFCYREDEFLIFFQRTGEGADWVIRILEGFFFWLFISHKTSVWQCLLFIPLTQTILRLRQFCQRRYFFKKNVYFNVQRRIHAPVNTGFLDAPFLFLILSGQQLLRDPSLFLNHSGASVDLGISIQCWSFDITVCLRDSPMWQRQWLQFPGTTSWIQQAGNLCSSCGLLVILDLMHIILFVTCQT